MKYTDLAIESASLLKDRLHPRDGSLLGVCVREEALSDDVLLTRVVIKTKEAAQKMQKPPGVYITLEAKRLLEGNPKITEEVIQALASELSQLIPFHDHLKVLIAGIGNEKITPDSLGPHTISKVRVTRHLFLAYQCEGDSKQANVAAISPGVMAQTGVETAEILRRLTDFLKPDFMIVIDSLAARDVNRMNTTIQMTDTGISPGAGTKNYRAQLTEKTVGCPVIAIGVPTVIHCQALLNDENAPDLIVTATNIDQVIHDFSSVIAEAINRALHPGLN